MPPTSESDWRKWGERDPYFAVVSWQEFSSDKLEPNRKLFFETGQNDISNVLSTAGRLYGDMNLERALDFGCGVGRLVLPLATRFKEVVGVDISERMIEEAARVCDEAGITNVEFVLSDGTLSKLTGEFDFLHSYNVLQHIPVDLGLRVTDHLLRRLRPGGIICLHYSIKRTLSPIKATAYAVKHFVPFGKTAMNLLQSRPVDAPIMQMNNYPLDKLTSLFEKNGVEDLFMVPEQHSSALTLRIYGRRKRPSEP